MSTPLSTPVTQAPEAFSRLRPVVTFALSLVFLALHHQYVLSQQEYFPKLVLVFSMTAGFGLGGILYPRMFHALSDDGKHLPMPMKVLGAACGLAGCGVGFWVLATFYG